MSFNAAMSVKTPPDVKDTFRGGSLGNAVTDALDMKAGRRCAFMRFVLALGYCILAVEHRTCNVTLPAHLADVQKSTQS